MKKNTLIFSLFITLISLTAYGFVNWNSHLPVQEKSTGCKAIFLDKGLAKLFNNSEVIDLVYNVDSRYINTITLEDLLKAKSILEILPEKATQSVESYQEVKISILGDDKETNVKGYGEVLNDAQIELLQLTEYSTNIFVGAYFKKRNMDTGDLEDGHLTYYMTILPEKEAKYVGGNAALIHYLRENSKVETSTISQDQLRPGQVRFTVTKNGTIANVKLLSTSGYSSVDKILVDLISNMPEQWKPATNTKGEKVEQTFIFFFGKEGC